MLKITLTPTRLYFKELSDEMQINLQFAVDLHHDKQGFYAEGDAQHLYKILLNLSYVYDIEIY